jgi:hypothetical protein
MAFCIKTFAYAASRDLPTFFMIAAISLMTCLSSYLIYVTSCYCWSLVFLSPTPSNCMLIALLCISLIFSFYALWSGNILVISNSIFLFIFSFLVTVTAAFSSSLWISPLIFWISELSLSIGASSFFLSMSESSFSSCLVKSASMKASKIAFSYSACGSSLSSLKFFSIAKVFAISFYLY